VLLIDEVLAVGDQSFTVKCIDKFAEFRRRNKSILLVTHSLDMVEKFCDRALWLDKGKTLAEGEPKRVVASYLLHVAKDEEAQLAKQDAANVAAVAEPQAAGPGATDHIVADAMPSDVVDTPADMFQATEGRWGTRELEITEVTLHGADGAVSHVFQSGDAIEIRLKTRAHQATNDFVFGIGLFNADGFCCYGTNTQIEELEPAEISGDGEVRFRVPQLDLVEGTYKIDVAAHRVDGYPYDYHRLLYTFRVKSRTRDVGVYRPRHTWDFAGDIRFQKDGDPTRGNRWRERPDDERGSQ
jgi:hypothetical protein